MPVQSCIPIIPSADLEKSLRLWIDGFGFSKIDISKLRTPGQAPMSLVPIVRIK